MSSLTLGLYSCSAVTIGLLVAFAARNRKAGWKKSRTSLDQALDDLYLDMGLGVNPGVHVDEKVSQPPVDPGDFSMQLIKLRDGLGESNGVAGQAEQEVLPVRLK
jgi:hypothetical protein